MKHEFAHSCLLNNVSCILNTVFMYVPAEIFVFLLYFLCCVVLQYYSNDLL